jgi:hypothetical protein
MKQHYNPYARQTYIPILNRRSDFTVAQKRGASDEHASLPLRPSNRKHYLAFPNNVNKGKKRSIEDVVVVAQDVVVAPALADCSYNMLDDGYFDDDDDFATENDDEAEWIDGATVVMFSLVSKVQGKHQNKRNLILAMMMTMTMCCFRSFSCWTRTLT